MIAVEAGIVICCFVIAYAIGWFATSYPKVFEESEPAPDAQEPAPIGITSQLWCAMHAPEAFASTPMAESRRGAPRAARICDVMGHY